jgi:hypothetical protein
MTGPGVSDSEMSSFPWPTRADARAFDALLAGNCPPEEAPEELRPVAEVLVALLEPPDQREVARWGEALSAYRGVAGRPVGSHRSRARRRRRIAAPFRIRLAAAGFAVVAVLGAGVAAAYGLLPDIWQQVTHSSNTASGPHGNGAAPAPGGSVHPNGPLAAGASSGTGSASHRRASASHTGGASHDLCYAWQQAEKSGNADRAARAWRALVNAAGGVYGVSAYCAGVRHPDLHYPSRYPSPRPLASSPAHLIVSPVPATEPSRLR